MRIGLWVALLLGMGAAQAKDVVGCIAQCDTQRAGCGPSSTCDTSRSVCVERCDPQRLSKSTVLAQSPTEGRTVDEPRHRLKKPDALLICQQDCALAAAKCGEANGHPEQCQMGKRACEERCDKKTKKKKKKQ